MKNLKVYIVEYVQKENVSELQILETELFCLLETEEEPCYEGPIFLSKKAAEKYTA